MPALVGADQHHLSGLGLPTTLPEGSNFSALGATDVAGIKEDHLLKALQKIAQMSNVMFISRCGDRAIDDPGFGADGNVLLHSEMPGVGLLARSHLRISGVSLVLC